jgi:hypothetical protein
VEEVERQMKRISMLIIARMLSVLFCAGPRRRRTWRRCAVEPISEQEVKKKRTMLIISMLIKWISKSKFLIFRLSYLKKLVIKIRK